MSAPYTIANLKTDVEDQALKYGMSPNLEGRFARIPLALEESGLSYQRFAPGYRLAFGHRHAQQEETYVILSGSGRAKLGDEIVELKAWDALRVPADLWRGFEAGDEGMELLAFGARCGMAADANDTEVEQGWWGD
jgi:mannose-6-phosphate isomerase-like protein (cupin superfamily)